MRRLTALLTCGLVAAVLAGCTPAEPTASTESAPVAPGTATAASEAPSEPPDAEPSPEAEEEPSDDAEATPEASASPAAVETGEPVAVVEGEIPGATLAVFPLRRVGDQVELEVVFAVNPDAEEPDNEGCRWVGESGCTGDGTLESPDDVGDFSGATLVDVENGQRHLVLRQTDDGECLCSRDVEQFFEPGQRYRFSATFAGPPEDVTSMTVEVPNFPAVPEVELR